MIQTTSAEQGILVTARYIISATGICLPPALIFPRVNFQPFMMHGEPPGALGLAQKTGWETAETFVAVMKHFIDFSNATLQRPALLILDNAECHLSLKAISLAKENGVIMLTLPPHCSHKLQPLDRTVFSAFKKYYNVSVTTELSKVR